MNKEFPIYLLAMFYHKFIFLLWYYNLNICSHENIKIPNLITTI